MNLRPSLFSVYLLLLACVACSILALAASWGVVSEAFTNELFQFAGLSLLCLLLFDGLLAFRKPELHIERQLPNKLSLLEKQQVSLKIHNKNKRSLRLELDEFAPALLKVSQLPIKLKLPPLQHLQVKYWLVPIFRGKACYSQLAYWLNSPLGLWQVKHYHALHSEVKVYPNFRQVSQQQLQGVPLPVVGTKQFSKRGEGMEFMQLREYRAGDALRQVDWKATSRRQKMISREYEEEKNQHVLILLDSGRRMQLQMDELSHFDHALNALILLAHTALKGGDVLSVMSFAQELRWLPSLRGASQINRLLNQFYDLQTDSCASDYLRAATELMEKQHKRALILLVTSLKDEDSQDLVPALSLLQKKHLVALINIREQALDEIDKEPIKDLDSALCYAASQELKEARNKHMAQLRDQGILVVDSSAAQLSSNMINTYLQVKKSGLL